MSHYTNLATVGVRLISCASFFVGFLGLTYSVFLLLLAVLYSPAAALDSNGTPYVNLVSSLLYTVGGLILFALSERIGRVLSKGLT